MQRLHEKNAALTAQVALLKRKLDEVTRLLEAAHDAGDASSPDWRRCRRTGLMALRIMGTVCRSKVF